MSYNEKQIQIIGEAEKLFASRGFSGTSVRDIGEAAGVNIAMISYYFGSKEKLLEAIFETRTEHIRITIEALLKETGLSYFEKVNRLIDEHINKAVERQLFYRIMIAEQIVDKNPAVIGAITELKKRNHEAVSKLIVEGQKAGEFSTDVDFFLLINTLLGTAFHTIVTQRYYREMNHLEELSDEAFINLLKQKLSIHIKKVFKTLLSNEI